MSTQLNQWRNYDSNASRREFLRRLGMGIGSYAAGASLFGCGRGNDAGAKNRALAFFGTGTLDIGDDGWRRLEKDLGARVTFKDNGNDVGPVITQMVAGNAAQVFDVGGVQGGAERELAKANVILPWNMDAIPNWSRVWPWVKKVPYAGWEGRQYGLPVVVNADSMIYLPDHVGEVDSYAAVFDPRFRGRTSMEDAWINSVIFAAIYLKQNGLARIEDPGNLSVDELRDVMEFLIKKKKEGQFRKFWSGWEDGLQLIRSQEVWVMTGWEPIAYAAQKEKINAKYAIPREGYEGWSNDLLLHVGAQARETVELAHEFANWELGGFYGCALSQLRGYVVPSDTAVEFARREPEAGFDPVAVERTSKHVEEKFLRMRGQVYWQNVRPTNYKLYEEWWSRLRSA